MSIKKNRLYEKRLTKEALNNLNYIDKLELEDEEDVISANVSAGLILAFLTFVSLVAMVIWFNKVTLFITIILVALLMVDWWLVFRTVKKYQKKLNKLNGIGTSND